MPERPERIWLSKEDVERLKEIEPLLSWAEEEIARAEASGLLDLYEDLRRAKEDVEKLRRAYTALITEYVKPE